MAAMPMAAPAPAPAEAESFAYGEVPITTHVFSAAHATPDALVELAESINARVRGSGVAPGDAAGNERLLQALQAEYRDFLSSFPLVLRWMVQMRQFSAKAFRLYLAKHAAAHQKGMRSLDEFNELQAEYLVLLERERCPRAPARYFSEFRASTVRALQAEAERFQELRAEAAGEIEAEAHAEAAERRQELYRLLLERKVALEGAGAPGGAPPPAGPD